jgi:hypothetical protein
MGGPKRHFGHINANGYKYVKHILDEMNINKARKIQIVSNLHSNDRRGADNASVSTH